MSKRDRSEEGQGGGGSGGGGRTKNAGAGVKTCPTSSAVSVLVKRILPER